LKSDDGHRPTLLAVVSYEDPSTLQLVLEAGAVAVIERPIRPFGLLTNLTIGAACGWSGATPKSACANWNASWREFKNSKSQVDPDGWPGFE